MPEKQRFVDAAAESIIANIEDAERGINAIEMCREEKGKGGHGVSDTDLHALRLALDLTRKRAREVANKIKVEEA